LSSRRRSQGKPIESVELKVGFRADRKTLLKIKKAVPEARWQEGELEVRLAGTGPAEMAREAKELSDRVRAALGAVAGSGRKGEKFQKTLRSAKRSANQK